MSAIVNLVGPLLSSLGSWGQYAAQLIGYKNSAAMQAGDENQKQVSAADKLKTDVANADTDATRTDLQ